MVYFFSQTTYQLISNRGSTTEHTLSILFSAQKNPQPSLTPPKIAVPPPTVDHNPQQASLHSFWAIPSRPSSCGSSNASTSSPPVSVFQTTHCENCDAPFALVNDDDAMDVDMDIDVYDSPTDHACTKCGKQVCHSCAVSNLGVERQCLICAGKRTWVGGIGWMDQD
jgi:hypothetical protein